MLVTLFSYQICKSFKNTFFEEHPRPLSIASTCQEDLKLRLSLFDHEERQKSDLKLKSLAHLVSYSSRIVELSVKRKL